MLVLDDWPRRRFARLLTIRGTESLTSRTAFDRFLAEECSGHPEEARALAAAREHDIPLRLLRGIAAKGEEDVVEELAEDLHFRAALQPEAARYAVSAWLEGLHGVPTDSLNAWLARVNPTVPRVPYGWGATIALADAVVSDTANAPAPTAAPRSAAVDFGDPHEAPTPHDRPPAAAAAPLDDWLHVALRVARADGHLTLEELDELVALAREHRMPDADIKHLVERVTLKGSFHDQLAGIVWYILPPSRRAGVHFGPAIPAMVRGAAQALCHVPKDEEVLAVLACEGDPVRMAFGTRAIYWHNAPDASRPGAFSIAYERLAKAPLRLAGEDAVAIGDDLQVHAGCGGVQAGELMLVLQALKGLTAWRAAHAAAMA